MSKKNINERQTKSETLKGLNRWDFEGNLDEIISHLQAFRAEHANFDSINVDISTFRGYYDSTEIEVDVVGTRLETDSEMNARIAKAKAQAESARRIRQEQVVKTEREERELLEKLASKFGKKVI